jgi:superfamily II DNA or RNA helicase
LTRVGSPTPNQRIIADHIMEEYFNDKSLQIGKSRLIANLDTGTGKSYLSVELIHRLKVRTLIVVPNSSILFDWNTKVLNKEFPNTVIGEYHSKVKKIGHIMIGVINSLVGSETFTFTTGKGKTKTIVEMTPNDFFKRFDLIIIDETQSYCSKENKKIFWKSAPYVLGLSATPTETTFFKLSTWGIGPILDAESLPGFEKKHSNFTGKVKMIKYSGHHSYITTQVNKSNGLSSTPLTLNLMAHDPHRIQVALNELIRLSKDHFVFVFSDRRELNIELARLFDLYQKDQMAKGIIEEKELLQCCVVMGGVTSSKTDILNTIENAEKNGNIIMSTYQYMGTGKSIPKMTSMILLTPRKSKIKQIIGRILRLGSDESIVREIVDIVDWKTLFRNQWSTRNKFYTQKNYEISQVLVDYKDVPKVKEFNLTLNSDVSGDGEDDDDDSGDDGDTVDDDTVDDDAIGDTVSVNDRRSYERIDEEYKKMLEEVEQDLSDLF